MSKTSEAAISEQEWFAANRTPPLDFTNGFEAWGFRWFRRFVWLLCKVSPRWGARYVRKYLYEPRRFPRPQRERELLKQAESFNLDFEDGQLACWRFAPLNAELPLKTALLVHGWEARGAQMGSLVEPLQRLGYQVYMVDSPAHGDSDGARTQPVQISRMVLRLQQKLKTIDLLVAHSVGAFASTLALQNGLTVGRFVSIAGVVDYRVVMRDVRLMFNVPASAKAEMDRQIEAELGMSWDALNVLQHAALMEQPCLYLHDPQDDDTPCFGVEAMSKAVADGEFLPVLGAGHRKILWDETTIAHMVSWLKADA
ncbi:MAG: alpha/beta fold hydrolase [Gammaproteobacteria bacterium]|nr:alpha/beta fold hydrolase [Gammaproteobacteria bacterium]